MFVCVSFPINCLMVPKGQLIVYEKLAKFGCKWDYESINFNHPSILLPITLEPIIEIQSILLNYFQNLAIRNPKKSHVSQQLVSLCLNKTHWNLGLIGHGEAYKELENQNEHHDPGSMSVLCVQRSKHKLQCVCLW
jgi:hypothetical protein